MMIQLPTGDGIPRWLLRGGYLEGCAPKDSGKQNPGLNTRSRPDVDGFFCLVRFLMRQNHHKGGAS